MPITDRGAFYTREELLADAKHHRSMAEAYLKICSPDDPRRARAEKLANAELKRAAEIERKYLQ